MGARFEVHDVVRLAVDLPELGLAKGELGTVIYIFSGPQVAYEIEFADSKGRTTAQLDLLPSQLALVERMLDERSFSEVKPECFRYLM